MKITRLLILSILIAFHVKASACSVPVFRYALNYWPADEYELRAPRAKLPADLSINLSVKASDAGPARLMLGEREVWTGDLAPDALAPLLDSPARRELVSRILHGDSVVWVLVESGDAAKDDSVARLLSERLRYLESIAVMPDLRPDDPSNRLGPGPALAIRHSVLRVSRKDPREAFTLAMLERETADPKAPAAYPVFGRGRVLIALPQEKLTADNIDEVCQFLTSACSCEVKDRRMGWDLLLPCDWDEELALAERRRLNGTPEPARAESPAAAPGTLKPETVTFQAQAPMTSPQRQGIWLRSPLTIAGISVIFIGVVGIWMRKRA